MRTALGTKDGDRWAALGVIGVGDACLVASAIAAPLDLRLPLSGIFAAVSGAFLALGGSILLTSVVRHRTKERTRSVAFGIRLALVGLVVVGSMLYALPIIGADPAVLASTMAVAAAFGASAAIGIVSTFARTRSADRDARRR